MPLYDKPIWLLMYDMVADLGIEKGDVLTKKQIQDWFAQHYPKVKESTISAHLIAMSTNAASRIHHNAKPGDKDYFFQIDSSRFRLYDAAEDPPPIYVGTETPAPVADETLESPEGPNEFAYESDLRDFLAKNLEVIEPGLRLYEDEGITGIEFPVGGRFIDILAIDREENFVVIELKVSRGYDRVVGQLLRYIAWIKLHHAEATQKVRGVIVARTITEDLVLACSDLSHVQLYEYELSVNLRKIEQ